MNMLNIELPPEIRPAEASLLLAIKLWETERVSLGQAAQLPGYSKRAFIEVMGKYGTKLLDYPAEDRERETEM